MITYNEKILIYSNNKYMLYNYMMFREDKKKHILEPIIYTDKYISCSEKDFKNAIIGNKDIEHYCCKQIKYLRKINEVLEIIIKNNNFNTEMFNELINLNKESLSSNKCNYENKIKQINELTTIKNSLDEKKNTKRFIEYIKINIEQNKEDIELLNSFLSLLN